MSRMAQRTILCNRCMLPKYGTTFFRMTGIACLVNGGLDQLCGIAGAVRLVTIAARQLRKVNRVCGWFIEIYTLFLMTAITHFGLRCSAQHRIAINVKLVTTHASEIAAFMCAGMPVNPCITTMAIKADLVLISG